MSRLRALIAFATGVLAMSTAPMALAHSSSVGSSTASPTANVCAGSIQCTYVNFKHGKPSDVVKHAGRVTDFSVNAGSINGQVQLRVLRPVGHGKFKVIRSSSLQTITVAGVNTFTTSLKVRTGDVLALSNDSSGIYMSAAPTGTCVRYVQGAVSDGATAKPDHRVPQLHLLLSAHVSS